MPNRIAHVFMAGVISLSLAVGTFFTPGPTVGVAAIGAVLMFCVVIWIYASVYRS
jgi:hypothetical protein